MCLHVYRTAQFSSCCMSSVLWHSWLGVRKSIRPVKIEWWGVGMVICVKRGADYLRMVQLIPLHLKILSSLASYKSRLVLPFWCGLTQVVLEKTLLNGRSSSSCVYKGDVSESVSVGGHCCRQQHKATGSSESWQRPATMSCHVHHWNAAGNYFLIYFASAAVAVDSSHMTASSSAFWSRSSPPSDFVSSHVSTMWFLVCLAVQSQEVDCHSALSS